MVQHPTEPESKRAQKWSELSDDTETARPRLAVPDVGVGVANGGAVGGTLVGVEVGGEVGTGVLGTGVLGPDVGEAVGAAVGAGEAEPPGAEAVGTGAPPQAATTAKQIALTAT
ncbi:MAG TPA: hypothetical protein VM284_04510 [Candidatus Limnocylindria bacterium]|nr:hypothetical protein [Candidatus Limnocylindria bacterium]